MAYPKKGTPEYEAWILTPEYKEHCRKSSEQNNGEKSPLFGTHLSEEQRKHLSNVNTGDKNPFFRKHHTVEAVEKNRVAHIGKAPWNKGKKCPQLAKIGEKNPMFGKPSHRKGKHHTKETREKMSKNHIGIQSKEKHPRWRGGITNDPYSPQFDELFKKQNRIRFGGVCLFPDCGMTSEENGRKLDVHHYDYNKNSLNCVPLCIGHNAIVNTNRDEWEEYFTWVVRMYLEWYGRWG